MFKLTHALFCAAAVSMASLAQAADPIIIKEKSSNADAAQAT